MSENFWRGTALLAALAMTSLVPGCTSSYDPNQTGTVSGAAKGDDHAPHAKGPGHGACKPGAAKPAHDHAARLGESGQCKALGIVACNLKFAGFAGENVYFCFDAQGKEVVSAAVSQVATAIPCSHAQLDAWVAAYAAPCWRLVPRSALPASAITLLLDTDQLPPQVCSNVDRTIFRFSAACANHTYTIAKDTGGGNFHGTYWSLDIAPPTTASLRIGYPFLACADYQATNDSGCLWHVGVVRDTAHVGIVADDITHPCTGPVVWTSVLALLTTAFTTCDATYSY